MFRDSAIARILIAVAIGLPILLFLGFQLATPDQISSIIWIGVAFCAFLVPLMIRWHHPMIILCWNLPFVVFFLPGGQFLWAPVAGVSLLFSVLGWTLQKHKTPLFIPSPLTTWPMIFLAVVVVFTMAATGGLHSKMFGSSEWGATRYISVIAIIIAYFALIAQRIPPERAQRMASLFFLTGTLWVLSVVGALIPRLDFLSYIIGRQGITTTDNPFEGTDIERFNGFYFAAQFLFGYMLIRYGIRGLFDWHRWWRAMFLAVSFGIGTLGGFRSFIVFTFILFWVQFYFERLFRTNLIVIILAGTVLAAIFTVSFSDQLPLPIQRSLSFIPGIKVSPVARFDAQETLEWRFDLWNSLLPVIPQYLFIGKGYGFDGSDLSIAMTANTYAWRHGTVPNPDDNYLAIIGDYHQGILTLIIPLGIWGVLAFAAFCWGAIRVLYHHYRHGNPQFKRINTFFLSFFIAKLVFYVIFYGQFYQDLAAFVGVVGLSLAINGSVGQKVPAANLPAVKRIIKTPRLQSA
jgi:hypothetical protein